MRGGAELFLQRSEDLESQLPELKCVIEEIAKRRCIEETLRRREKDFHAIVDKNADAMVVIDTNGVIRYANPAAITLFNLPEDEIIDHVLGSPIIQQEPVDMDVLRGFREVAAVEMRMVEVEWESKLSYLISFRDVSRHVRLEEELGRARDELEARVRKRTSELENANEKLHEEIEAKNAIEEELRLEIEERSTAEEELRIEIEHREKIDDALEESKAQAELYLDLMGHDINNLNQIGIGYLELAMESSDPDEIKSLLAKPLEVMHDASRIIGNVRKIKQITIDETRGDYGKQIVNLSEILPALKERYSDVNGREITINLTMPPLVFVKANELIKDVFSNLIDNSIKHSDPDRSLAINITIRRQKDHKQDYYLCYVEDNGPGIPDWIKDKIFQRFQRGNTKARGKGLGLYLVKKLVDDYHGAVWVEDRVPGDYTKGAKFVVMLPVAV
jgi:signal transduction histidine kinase